PLLNVQLMFGGVVAQRSIILHIWDDAAGTLAPGTEIYSTSVNLTGSNETINVIDLEGVGIDVDGPIRVGVQFTQAGLPCIARDGDGTIDAGRNFVYSEGAWYQSSLFGLTGDWIIRAETAGSALFSVGGTVSGLSGSLTLRNNGGDDLTLTSDGPFTFATPLLDGSPYEVSISSSPPGQDFEVLYGAGVIAGVDVNDVLVAPVGVVTDLLRNDGWSQGAPAAFQGGFVVGEIAAARFIPANADSWDVESIQLLYGGATTQQTLTLKIWDDAAGTAAPGAELFSQDFQLTGGDALQAIDLGGAGIGVGGAFRVGLQFHHSGYPSIARDADGNMTAGRNFVYTAGSWQSSELLGLTGDWILRAVVSQRGQAATALITAVADLPRDQGRQVRIAWTGDGRDAAGSTEPVTGYAVFRRIDDGYKAAAGGAGPADKTYPPGDWDYLKTVPAFQEAAYATIAPTVADSTIADGMHFTTFFVRAMTAVPGVYFDSAPDSGYSVDNLVPHVPQGLAVDYDAMAGNALTWQANPEADFAYFKVYRGDGPDFAVDPDHPAHTTASTAWLDADGGFQAYYRVAAVDFSGNESAPTAYAGTQTTGADGETPGALALFPCRPNPFNPSTTISFLLSAPARATLVVFDARGRRVRGLLDESRPAGPASVVWDGRDDAGRALPGGVYVARLSAGSAPLAIKLSLIP
ncbi:MAG: FlgD immunoglobulin-like domain containing protein, partial [bacterium]|nr:FlgD immunoglobulin-like domain containing protein [bacterium]